SSALMQHVSIRSWIEENASVKNPVGGPSPTRGTLPRWTAIAARGRPRPGVGGQGRCAGPPSGCRRERPAEWAERPVRTKLNAELGCGTARPYRTASAGRRSLLCRRLHASTMRPGRRGLRLYAPLGNRPAGLVVAPWLLPSYRHE